MKELTSKWTGIVPLLMHCNQTANPLNRYAQALKHLTSKRNKTDLDHMEISRIEWEAGLYLRNGIIVMPAENISACLLKAAKRTKNGTKYQSGAMIAEDYFVLDYKGPKIKVKMNGEIPNPELDKYYEHFKHQAIVKVGNQQIVRTRPIFYEWSFEITILIDDTIFDDRTVRAIMEDAGRFVGLCERRPPLGRFEVK